ncbi:MAG TPA: hypothetical protein VNJ12_04580 [Candidatus Dormibacteraeota bacterium]|nr:hypothetical protein [Candidatus Dormibacteraeota bacterium]
MHCTEQTTNGKTFSNAPGALQANYVPTVSFEQGKSAAHDWESVRQVEARQNMNVNLAFTNTRLVIRPEDFIWLELSIVPEVERVFVERRGSAFQVMTVVNDRSPELRRRIFAREKAIIDDLSQYEFDFDLLTRMNCDLEDLVTTCDRPSYAR